MSNLIRDFTDNHIDKLVKDFNTMSELYYRYAWKLIIITSLIYFLLLTYDPMKGETTVKIFGLEIPMKIAVLIFPAIVFSLCWRFVYVRQKQLSLSTTITGIYHTVYPNNLNKIIEILPYGPNLLIGNRFPDSLKNHPERSILFRLLKVTTHAIPFLGSQMVFWLSIFMIYATYYSSPIYIGLPRSSAWYIEMLIWCDFILSVINLLILIAYVVLLGKCRKAVPEVVEYLGNVLKNSTTKVD